MYTQEPDSHSIEKNKQESSNNIANSLTKENPSKSNAIQIPEIKLPKGGGALKGIDEKFKVNSANGTTSFGIPLPLSPGRNGFAPSLSLSYNSGSGNSPFGIGWSVDYLTIQRKTDKQLPRYRDALEEDVFMLSGTEDLVPILEKVGNSWITKRREMDEFIIHSYRPRIEGGFSRIERISRKDSSQIYWKVTTKENISTFFGFSQNSQIFDPEDDTKVFAWLPEFSFDDKGNWLRYQYKAEDLVNVPNEVQERNRINGLAKFINRYLKRVHYGNRLPWYADHPFSPTLPEADAEFFFELLLDYGEHKDPEDDTQIPTYEENRSWNVRSDAFSSYRSGFEIRTYRRCFNILMFHHFPEEQQFVGTPDEEVFGQNYLVKSLNLTYEPSSINQSGQAEVSYLKSITQKGFIRKEETYFEKSLPPMQFTYQQLQWNTEVKDVDQENIINAPVGLSNNYQWVDLYGEGINGILTEQAEGWYYKSNLGDIDGDKQVRFSRAEQVVPKPSISGLGLGVLTIQDLDANGKKQVVVNNLSIQGYFEITPDNDIFPFRSFEEILNINLQDSNTRLLDLNGDGQPEIVVTEENVFTWYPSNGKKGYKQAERVSKPFDEEQGPALVFADQNAQESVYLADMSGDGLTDIVRVRNGEICYWANKGYGQFSAKITMHNAPIFDYPDQFNPAFLHLADVSGTGATDILYLSRDKIKVYLNLSGNAWSNAHEIEALFPVDNHTQLSVIDLLGTGTSCLVWSSGLPAKSKVPMRYMDLMDSKKPHVLKKFVNNFGKETTLEYKSSTYFYLKDKLEGKPWTTKLPFPVQVVAKTLVEDKITDVRFTTEYRYHHGYYDHAEQEFRGFGMVEQLDTEVYESWKESNAGNQLEKSEELYQAPTLTKTWYHTGAFMEREKILTQFKEEYWTAIYNQIFPDAPIHINEPELEDARITGNAVLEGLYNIAELTPEEYREALRACKGMVLRQEVFALDASAENPSLEALQKEYKPYTVATHSSHIQLLQPKAGNKYASFILTESEAITIHYERDETDPRMAHTLNIRLDEIGNILETASVVYPRKNFQTLDDSLNAATVLTYEREGEKQTYQDSLQKLKDEQAKIYITYTRNRFSNDVIQDATYRLRKTTETETFEITGLAKAAELYRIQDFENILTDGSNVIAYHETPAPGVTQRRLIEHIRTLYYNENLTAALPLGQLSSIGIPYESYQLAYTPVLLNILFGAKIADPNTLLGDEGKFVHSEGDDNWWIRSGTTQIIKSLDGEDINTARNHFYSPIAYQSPFGSETEVTYYKDYFLMSQSLEDTLGNKTEVEQYNFRILAPIRIKDVNDNFSEVLLDELGLVKASAVLGKGNEADQLTSLTEFTLQAENDTIQQFFTLSDTPALRTAAQDLLQGASTRFVYDFNRYQTSVQLIEEQLEDNPDTLPCAVIKHLPTVIGTITREQHYAVSPASPLQLSFGYSDGMGNVAMVKVQAEAGEALNLLLQPDCTYMLETVDTEDQLRWLGNGRTVLNNKGNPVKQYEPYFSVSPFYEDNKELVERGVSPIFYYDGLGRNIRTALPDGTFTKVEFTSWQQLSYDQNDTVQESLWYSDRINRRIDAELVASGKDPAKEQAASEKAARHDNTPAILFLDTLGRPVLSIVHNKVEEKDPLGNIIQVLDEFYSTCVELDIEGNARKVVDARGNSLKEYAYDMLGHRVYERCMDAGERWNLFNVVGNPIRNWDSLHQTFSTTYDLLQRPMEMRVQREGEADVFLYEKVLYGEAEADAKAKNLRRQVYQHYDSSGRTTNLRYDFKGNLLEAQRQLAAAYNAEVIDWTGGSPTNQLEPETFTSFTEHDALNRMIRRYNWHRNTNSVTVYEPIYNARGLLEAEDHITASQKTAGGYTGGRRITAVSGIEYNPKGQRTYLHYGNETTTRYLYDTQTFRLIQLRTTGVGIDRSLPSVPSNLTDPNVLQNLYYTYDAVGNILEIEDDAYEPVFFQNQAVEPKSKFTYDALYRLLEAEGRENNLFDLAPGPQEPSPVAVNFPSTDQTLRNYTQIYHYDAVGNMLHLRHISNIERWTRNYEYTSNSNRLFRSWKGSDIINAIVYQYDVRGNMLNYNNSPEEYQPEWDYRGMAYHLNLGGGGEAYYQYSTDRERSRKRIERLGGTVEERLYLGGMEVYRRWNAGVLVEEIETNHLFVDDRRVLVVENVLQTDNNNLNVGILDRYQYSNQVGSVGLELDGNAAIISYEEYHPYGTVAYHAMNAAVKASAKRYRYTGMERDEESGLNYHSARYYMPWLGRWLSADPFGIKGGLNVYEFCKSNPVLFVDPKGTQSSVLEEEGILYAEMFGPLIEFFIGGNWDIHSTPEPQLPEGGVGGVVGGAAHEVTFRQTGVLEDYPSTISRMGMETGGRMVPVIDPALRLYTGETVTGLSADPDEAAFDLFLDVTLLGVEGMAMSMEMRGARAIQRVAELDAEILAIERRATRVESSVADATRVERDALLEERERLVRLLHKRELGLDQHRGRPEDPESQWQPREADTASAIEATTGRRLRRAEADEVGDWVDASPRRGTTYDAVGPVPPEYFRLDSFTNQITGHLNKQGLDRVVVDLRGLADEDVLQVRDFITGLDQASQARIMVLY